MRVGVSVPVTVPVLDSACVARLGLAVMPGCSGIITLLLLLLCGWVTLLPLCRLWHGGEWEPK